MQNRLRASKTLENAFQTMKYPIFILSSRNSYRKIRKSYISWSGRRTMRVQGFSMRAIDFSHKITPNESFWRKIFAKKLPDGGFLENPLQKVIIVEFFHFRTFSIFFEFLFFRIFWTIRIFKRY